MSRDKILMFIGTIAALAQGVTLPANLAVFGEIIDSFVSDRYVLVNKVVTEFMGKQFSCSHSHGIFIFSWDIFTFHRTSLVFIGHLLLDSFFL